MSEGERQDIERREFLKRFALGAAAVPMVTRGVFRFPDIGGHGRGWGHVYGYGYGHVYGRGYGHLRDA